MIYQLNVFCSERGNVHIYYLIFPVFWSKAELQQQKLSNKIIIEYIYCDFSKSATTLQTKVSAGK